MDHHTQDKGGKGDWVPTLKRELKGNETMEGEWHTIPIHVCVRYGRYGRVEDVGAYYFASTFLSLAFTYLLYARGKF